MGMGACVGALRVAAQEAYRHAGRPVRGELHRDARPGGVTVVPAGQAARRAATPAVPALVLAALYHDPVHARPLRRRRTAGAGRETPALPVRRVPPFIA